MPKKPASKKKKTARNKASVKKKVINEDKETVFELSDSIDITTINGFYDELKLLLKNSKLIVIDAKNVNRLDTSAIQLLCSWYTDASKKGIDVKWKNVDGTFFNSVKLLGLTEHLSLE